MRSLFTNVDEYIRLENKQENQISNFIEEIRRTCFQDPDKKLKPILMQDLNYHMDNNVRRYRLSFEGIELTDPDCYLVYIKF